MCGISGIIKSGKKPAIREMVETLSHRGPDDDGIWEEAEIALGFNRLAIIDLSVLGHQPMISHCGRYVMVFNGEIYNFPDLRDTLEKLGHKFRSQSDSEVILQAYVQWGRGMMKMLNGMFAFAIWDRQEKKLFAARDPYGIKPFYYYQRGHDFVFASEIKALLRSEEVPFRIDDRSVFQYLVFGNVQQPLTIIKDVFALMPGHILVWDARKVTIEKYWELPPASESKLNYQDAKMMLREKLRLAVKRQTISDRPVGIFLSSGLDSVSLLAAMNWNSLKTQTFSIGFEENALARNELREADKIANFYGTTHNSITLDSKQIASDIDNFFKSLDQPSTDGLNTYLVSKYAVKQMAVALSGLGGDELFAGYPRHALIAWKEKNLKRAQGVLYSNLPLKNVWDHGYPGSDYIAKGKIFYNKSNTKLNFVGSRTSLWPESLHRVAGPLLMYMKPFEWYSHVFDEFTLNGESDVLTKVLNLDMNTFMSSMLLRDMDAVSMGHSLEVRFPLLDNELINFAWSLPSDYKLQVRSGKRPPGEGALTYAQAGGKKILLDAMLPDLPEGFESQKKNGFKLPLEMWLKNELQEYAAFLIHDQRDLWSNWLNPTEVSRSFDSLREGKSDGQAWRYFSFMGTLNALNKL